MYFFRKIFSGTITRTLCFAREILTKKDKVKTLKVTALMFVNSGIEVLGLAALIPIFNILLDPSFIKTNKIASELYYFLGFKSEQNFIVLICIVLVIFFLAKNVISLFIHNYQSKFAYTLSQKLAMQLHLKYFSYGFSFFKNNSSNKILHNIHDVTLRFAQFQVLGLINLFNELMVMAILTSGIVIFYPGIFVLLVGTILPVFLFFYMTIKRKITSMGAEFNVENPKLRQVIFQSIFGYIDVRISNTLQNFRNRINSSLASLTKINTLRTVYNLAPTKVIEIALVSSICLIIIYSTLYSGNTSDTAILLGVFGVSGYRILPSVNRIMIALMGLKETEYSFEVLRQLKNHSPYNNKKDTNKIQFEEKISFDKVSFKFEKEGEYIFKDLNFSIKKGDIVGIIGESGSGKTTLMNLMLGFLSPTAGSVNIDHTQLSENSIQSYHNIVGYVQQQVYLVDATLAENIAFGCEIHEIDEAKVKKVIKQASLDEFVTDLNLGIHTIIGENGTRLSGGQRQRVGIARALYFDSSIFFFDEATSALDDKTEEEITKSIDDLNDGNITMFIIAHRLSTLKNCTKIIKVENKGITIVK